MFKFDDFKLHNLKLEQFIKTRDSWDRSFPCIDGNMKFVRMRRRSITKMNERGPGNYEWNNKIMFKYFRYDMIVNLVQEIV